MEVFKREREKESELRNLGAVFFLFDSRDPEGTATCVGSINPEGVVAACRGILKKLGRDPDSVIWTPGRN